MIILNTSSFRVFNEEIEVIDGCFKWCFCSALGAVHDTMKPLALAQLASVNLIHQEKPGILEMYILSVKNSNHLSAINV